MLRDPWQEHEEALRRHHARIDQARLLRDVAFPRKAPPGWRLQTAALLRRMANRLDDSHVEQARRPREA